MSKKYYTTVTPLFKAGYQMKSLSVNPEILEVLSNIEAGGRLIVRTLKEESRTSDKSPVAYLDYMTPAEVEAEKKEYQEKRAQGGL